MTAVERWLIAGVGMDRRHDPALDPDRVMQHLCQRGQAIGGAGTVRYQLVTPGQLAVVHAVNDCFVDVFRGGRDQYTLCAAGKVYGGLLAVVELAGAFQNHVHPLPI